MKNMADFLRAVKSLLDFADVTKTETGDFSFCMLLPSIIKSIQRLFRAKLYKVALSVTQDHIFQFYLLQMIIFKFFKCKKTSDYRTLNNLFLALFVLKVCILFLLSSNKLIVENMKHV